jgi:hypothetical protein
MKKYVNRREGEDRKYVHIRGGGGKGRKYINGEKVKER